jgi:hypothetical protein
MLGIQTVKNILINANTTVTNALKGTEWVEKKGTLLQKTIATSTGAMGAAKGTVDLVEDLVCQDYVCFAVDCIGILADGFTCFTSFIPGPNVTSVVTIPVSLACKTFRWCCKRAELPFGCKR